MKPIGKWTTLNEHLIASHQDEIALERWEGEGGRPQPAEAKVRAAVVAAIWEDDDDVFIEEGAILSLS